MAKGTLAERLSGASLSKANRVHRASLFVKIVLIAVASLVSTIAQFLQSPNLATLTSIQIIGIASSIVVAIGAVFVVITDQNSSEELHLAQQAIEETAEVSSYLDEYADNAERVLQLYQSAMAMRTVIESAAVEKLKIEPVVKALIETTLRSLPIALGFAQSDVWTICIYRAEHDSTTSRDSLVCIGLSRAIGCDPDKARSWPEGVGVAGVSYRNKSEIIVPDMTTAGLGSMFTLAVGAKPYDDDRYKSIVSVPVKVERRDKPWGVVVATCDQINHFTAIPSSTLKTAEAARLLAGMVALAVAVCDTT